MELPTGHKDKKKFWKDHVKAASEFSGSDIEYCKSHGLQIRTFSSYKTRFGFTKKGKSLGTSSFVPIALRNSRPHDLPDPKWLAELIFEIQGKFKP